ncbi:MAG: hypothetical protein AAGG38_11165 [Planctomycetota bacterium]
MKPAPSSDAPSLGSRLDALLQPFVNDEAELSHRLDQLQQQIDLLQTDADEAERDLQVVRAAKVDALRHAVADDPLLRAAFGPSEPADATPLQVVSDAPHLADPDAPHAEAEATRDGHPLLSPTG